MDELRQPRQSNGARHSRAWLAALIVVAVLATMVVIAWLWVLPYYIEKRLVDTYSSMTGREVTIDTVSIAPFSSRVILDGVSIAGEEETPVFASERIVAVIRMSSLHSAGWHLDRLALDAPRLQMIQQSDGEWNLEHLFGDDESPDNEDSTPVRIDRIQVERGQLEWINHRPTEPVTLSLESLKGEARGYDSTSEEPFSLKGQADWNGGTLSGEGEMGFAPWTVHVELDIEEVPLDTLSGYLAHVLRARVGNGLIDARIQVQAGAVSDTGTRVAGSGGVEGVDMVAPEDDASLATADRLSIEELRFESETPRLAVDRIVLEAPWLDVTLDENLNTNLGAWRSPQRRGENEEGPGLAYALEALVVEGGAVAFTDRHMAQPFEVDLSSLSGEWRDMTSAREGDGPLRLEGMVADGSPMRIEGTFDPFGEMLQGHLELHFDSLPLTTFAPYLVEFGGYEIEGGEATLDLDYRIEDGELRAVNHLLLRRVELGEQVDDSVTDLPMRALVEVLQSDDGTIDLDVPMRLPLDDPSAVDFGDIAGQAIREALENALSSPLEAFREAVKAQREESDDDESHQPDDDEPNLYDRAETPRQD